MSQQDQKADPYLVIRNLQSACNELEAQNNGLKARSVEIAVQRDRAIDQAQLFEARVKQLEELLSSGTVQHDEDVIEEVPAPVAKRIRKSA